MDKEWQWYRERQLEEAVKALIRHEFNALWVPTADEAKVKVLEMIPQGAVVGVGGSMTIRELGLIEALEARGTEVVHHWKPGLSRKEDLDIRHKELNSDVFLASPNAISLTGELLCADGFGNRVAAMMFGPEKVILVAGVNKLVDDAMEGLWRIKNVAGVINHKRLGKSTPCVKTGRCSDCEAPDRGCRVITIIERKPTATDLNVVLVNEILGF